MPQVARRLSRGSGARHVFALNRCFTLAPTALAALVAARAGARCFITDPAVLPARLKPLPIGVLRWPEEENASPRRHGRAHAGRAPAPAARRFRAALRARAAGGSRPAAGPPRRSARALKRRERYVGRIDLDHEIENHERILQVLRPLLEELQQFLCERQRGITALQCRFHHYRAAPTVCALRLAAPEADAGRLLSLLRERLATLVLPEPVRRCELRGGALSERPLASKPLWSPGEHGHAQAGEMPALVEHLRARLGNEAVYGIRCVSEHRPENAWQREAPICSSMRGWRVRQPMLR